MALLIPIAWALLRWRSAGVADAVIVGRYLVLAGVLRFAIEFIRVNERVAGPFTLAHLVSGGIALVGVAMLARRRA
jgi:prolipoprotein diacylglyceryltransferase